jgi:uncharacterized protein
VITYVVICIVSLLVSALTLVSGFGLGTLLMPAFAAFFPLAVAVAATAVVHLANNLAKLALVGRDAHIPTVLRFTSGALPAALLGAWLLTHIGEFAPLTTYSLGAVTCEVTPLKLVVGGILIFFAAIEFAPGFDDWAVNPKWLPLGGALSGFFGGLTGMQGAVRAAFLVRCGLTKEQFVGTGAVVSTIIDLTRLAAYFSAFVSAKLTLISSPGGPGWPLITAACVAAFAGSYLGSRIIKKVTIRTLKIVVAVGLGAFGIALALGIL